MSAETVRSLLAVALAFTLLLVLGHAVDGRRSSVPEPVSAPTLVARASEDCGRWSILAGRGQAGTDRLALHTDGIATLVPCGGTALLSLWGTQARGQGPWVVVVAAGTVVFAGHLDVEPVELAIDGAFWLGFSNDLATAGEDRNVHATVR